MKDLVIILGSFSCTVTPHHHHRQSHRNTTKPKAKAKPNPSVTKLSPQPALLSSSTSPINTVDSYAPLLSSLRWDRSTNLEYYANLATKLGKDGRLDDFALVVETLLASGVGSSSFVAMLNVDLVAKGVSQNLREGKVTSVVEVMGKVQKLGVDPSKLFDGSAMELMKREFRRMVNSGEVEETVRLMGILAGFQFRIKKLANPYDIVKLCVHNSNPNMAIRYACLLPRAHILFCRIIYEFGKKRDLVSALAAYEASKQNLDGPNMYVYRTIIDVCGRCGDYMKSRHIYEDLLKQNVKPNIYVFNSLMNVNAHDLVYTLHVYKNMQNIGIMADMASYNILLKVCCLAGRVDLAQDIYGEAKQLESAGGLKLDVFTYCTIIKVFADARLWQMALKVKEDMQSAGVTPNTITWSSLISACANAGLVEQANHLFEEMLQAGCEPNSQCCNILLHACVEAKQYDLAFRLFLSWKGSTVQESFCKDYESNKSTNLSSKRPNKIFTSKLNCMSSSLYLSFSKKFAFTPTTTTYNIMLKACGTDYYRAKDLMDEMKAVGLSPNHISWSILIDICGGSGKVEGAIRILKTMHATGSKPDVVAYTTAIKVCVERKSLQLAFSLFEEMKRFEIQPNLVTYHTLLRARSRYGSLHEVQQCLAVYQDMRKAGYRSNDYYLKELIEEWCEGVIQGNNLNQSEISSCRGSDLGRCEGLLLEKVAAHLHKGTDSLTIDLQGLTKVEARMVVLAVLRMVKEKYALGDAVKEDMSIILGSSTVHTDTAKGETVKGAVIKLLQDELGLEVVSAGPRTMMNRKAEMQNSPNSDPNLEEASGWDRLPTESVSSTRRPAILQRLKVTKESLLHWLQRRAAAT